MTLAVEHEGLSHFVVVFSHKGNFYLVLHVFYAHAIAEAEALHNAIERFGINVLILTLKGFDDCCLNLFNVQRLGLAVALCDNKVVGTHSKKGVFYRAKRGVKFSVLDNF